MWVRNIFYSITVTQVLSIDITPSGPPQECIDESPFCVVMATEGECYSGDASLRANMHDVCRETCGTCISSIPSCENGTERFNDKTNTTCCHVNNTAANSHDFSYSYTEYKSGGVTYRNFSNDSGACAPVPMLLWWPWVFGGLPWYWMFLVAIFGMIVGFFISWIMFGQREEDLDQMLETIGRDSGKVFKKASEMTVDDITIITEHYTMMAAMSTFKSKEYITEGDDKETPEGEPLTPYTVLVAIFKKSNIDGLTTVDKADFNMAISNLGISPTNLDISNVFERLDDGSRTVNVDQLYEKIKENISTEWTPEFEDITTVLKAAVIQTFVRERRASLSILKKFTAAHQTPGGFVSSDEDVDEPTETPRFAGSSVRLVKAETAFKVIGEPEKLRSHEFNALLISMGVPFSENIILERVMKLEALQPDGIDGEEFKDMLKKELEENPDALKSDIIVKVLDNLIAHHGGQAVAKTALKTHHNREVMLTKAGTMYHSQWSSDGALSDALGGDEKLAHELENMIQELTQTPGGPTKK